MSETQKNLSETITEKNENLTPEELEAVTGGAGSTSRSQSTDLKIRVQSNLSTTQQVIEYQSEP